MTIPNLMHLPPAYAKSYLEARGWAAIDEEPERYILFGRRIGKRDYEAFVPLQQSFLDYERRLRELLVVLREVENRSEWAIAEDIFSAAFDVVRIGAEHADFVSGSVSLDAGVALVNSAREMVLAASCATVERRAYFSSRRPALAADLVKRARLGQTERGSYVVKVFIPMPAAGVAPLFSDVVEEPFERQATKTLVRAVRAVAQAAKESEVAGNMKPFLARVKSGVTANLCDAIADIHTGAGADSIKVAVGWSVVVPEKALAEPIVIDSAAARMLREAGRFLKGAPTVRKGRLITGAVTDLHHEGEPEGRIIIATVLEDKKRKVAMRLPRELYRQAVFAHDNELPVVCRGELIQRSRQLFELIDVEEFTLISQLTLRDPSDEQK